MKSALRRMSATLSRPRKPSSARGAKANHLTYLGDTEIGERTNIGAGTITCNYDGVNKHKTVIGAGAFIGSDTTLVAPIRIGDGAYVGAGSCITQDVPDDSLGLTRPELVIKEGWAAAKRAKLEAEKAEEVTGFCITRINKTRINKGRSHGASP